MIDSAIVVAVTAIYLSILFYIAYRCERNKDSRVSQLYPVIYVLSLTVYCTSWTFYGAVGNAAQSGLSFFTIYLGPILVFIFFFPFIKKIIAAAKRHKTTSIADFIATRYGKSKRLSAIVTIIALMGTMPYIALQIKAIANTYDTLTGNSANLTGVAFFDTAFVLSIILAIFSILFGARTIDASQHHRGLIHAISFESIIKLFAFLAIAVLAFDIVVNQAAQAQNNISTIQLLVQPFESFEFSTDLLTKTFLAAGAIILLPRQFHVLVVEARGGEDLSRWGLPLYLMLFSLAVVPIVAAGLLIIDEHKNPDLYVLLIPMVTDHSVLSILSFLGGFSAATGMVIVATIALSTMVSNELIFPILVRFYQGNTHQILLIVRRLTILAIVLLAYGYYYVGGTDKSLQSIGLVSFAIAIQLLPSILASVYWHRANKQGVFVGLVLGLLVWFYCLFLPSLVHSSWMPTIFIDLLADKNSFWNPNQLFGIHFNDALTHAVFWSLFFNILSFIYFSLKYNPSLVDRLQAASYIDQTREMTLPQGKFHIKVSDLLELCTRFTGEERTKEYFLEQGCDTDKIKHQVADDNFMELTERLLASSIGLSSAEHLIRSAALPEQNLYGFIDQTGQAIEFNREILKVTFDHIGQAVSVVDADLRLVVWNRQYLELFNLDPDFVRAGKPVDEVIRFNLKRGYGPVLVDGLETQIERRLEFLRYGKHFTFSREWQDGRIIQTQGARLPDGGYITTYTDITPLKQVEKRLAAINETLEAKVIERTEKLSEVNQQLEDVINNKTHFLAAASHDLAQPLSASKLYLGTLLEELTDEPDKQKLAQNSLNALNTAESLLKSLLNLSKLDSGVLIPELRNISINEILREIQNEFLVIAKRKNIQLKIIYTDDKKTRSDRTLLLSILQNLVSNAIRYTQNGKVIVACRWVNKNECAIEVRDSGAGIPEEKQEDIFQPFKQLEKKNKQGAGLGLAICRQASELLNHEISLRSNIGQGTTFKLVLPKIYEESNPMISANTMNVVNNTKQWLINKKILCVDDDQDILQASEALLNKWGAQVTGINKIDDYEKMTKLTQSFDIVLMDYQLDREDLNGLDLLKLCRKKCKQPFVGVLVTAEYSQQLEEQVNNNGFKFLPKPVEPAKLRSLLQSAMI
ncbi:MAG: PAS-domain containing protein [Gammaproteobacteria bacterium]|nr:PAS-domain containing protein [Gammaproteobacteria bacterium]